MLSPIAMATSRWLRKQPEDFAARATKVPERSFHKWESLLHELVSFWTSVPRPCLQKPLGSLPSTPLTRPPPCRPPPLQAQTLVLGPCVDCDGGGVVWEGHHTPVSQLSLSLKTSRFAQPGISAPVTAPFAQAAKPGCTRAGSSLFSKALLRSKMKCFGSNAPAGPNPG